MYKIYKKNLAKMKDSDLTKINNNVVVNYDFELFKVSERKRKINNN